MKRSLLALGVLLVMTGTATAQDAGEQEAQVFSISSLNTPFAMQGEFGGTYRMYPDRIEVRVTKANILISDHCPYKGRRVLAAVKFGLATRTDSVRWKLARAGQQVFVGHVMSPGDSHTLGEMFFLIPLDDSIDLSKHWLIVRMEDNVLDVPKEEKRTGYAYAHSSRDIFTKPR